MLRIGDFHAGDRLARPGRAAFHPDVQLGPLLPVEGGAADGPAPAPGRHRTHDVHDVGHQPRLPGLPERLVRHPRRGAGGRGLPHADVGQVACGTPAEHGRAGQLARRAAGLPPSEGAGVRRLLRDDRRGRLVLQAHLPDAQRGATRPDRARLVLHGSDHRPRGTHGHRSHGRRGTILPVPLLHRSPLAAPRPPRRHRPLREPLPGRMGLDQDRPPRRAQGQRPRRSPLADQPP